MHVIPPFFSRADSPPSLCMKTRAGMRRAMSPEFRWEDVVEGTIAGGGNSTG